MIIEDIPIRSIQHFLYCPHRWGLMEIDCAWAENFFVTKANIIHNRVHDIKSSHYASGKNCYTSVSVYNDEPEYNLYGVTDCIEISSKKGSEPCIVEYKPTKPKNKEYNFEDLMQVFAQKICVDYVFNCDCDGILYYADVKKRVRLPLKENFEEYNTTLKTTLMQMREYLSIGKIPTIQKGKKCNGCSMKDICIPSIKIKNGVRSRIEEIVSDDFCEKESLP